MFSYTAKLSKTTVVDGAIAKAVATGSVMTSTGKNVDLEIYAECPHCEVSNLVKVCAEI